MTLERTPPATPSLPEWLGMFVEGKGDGRAVVRLRPTPEAQNYRGSVHGGALATLADVAMAVAAMTVVKEGSLPVTSGLELHYLRPAQGELVAEAKTVHRGSSRIVTEALVSDSAGRAVVVALGSFAIIGHDPNNPPIPDLLEQSHSPRWTGAPL